MSVVIEAREIRHFSIRAHLALECRISDATVTVSVRRESITSRLVRSFHNKTGWLNVISRRRRLLC